MGVIIPLITFPYSSRVLGPEALGKVDYAQANMTYFTLLQAFGIGGYAIREGARIRDDRKKIHSWFLLQIRFIISTDDTLFSLSQRFSASHFNTCVKCRFVCLYIL